MSISGCTTSGCTIAGCPTLLSRTLRKRVGILISIHADDAHVGTAASAVHRAKRGRMPRPCDLAGSGNKVGAPSFAHFAKGGKPRTQAQRGCAARVKTIGSAAPPPALAKNTRTGHPHHRWRTRTSPKGLATLPTALSFRRASKARQEESAPSRTQDRRKTGKGTTSVVPKKS